MITTISSGMGTDAISQSPNGLPVLGNSIRTVPSQVQHTVGLASTSASKLPQQTISPSNIANLQPVAPNQNAIQMPSLQNMPKGDAKVYNLRYLT